MLGIIASIHNGILFHTYYTKFIINYNHNQNQNYGFYMFLSDNEYVYKMPVKYIFKLRVRPGYKYNLRSRKSYISFSDDLFYDLLNIKDKRHFDIFEIELIDLELTRSELIKSELIKSELIKSEYLNYSNISPNKCIHGILGGQGWISENNYLNHILKNINPKHNISLYLSCIPYSYTFSYIYHIYMFFYNKDINTFSSSGNTFHSFFILPFIKYLIPIEKFIHICEPIKLAIGLSTKLSTGYIDIPTYTKKIGVLCTNKSKILKLYDNYLGIRCVYPTINIDNLIIEIKKGNIKSAQTELNDLINQMDCQIIILGCTELSVCSYDNNHCIILDSGKLLAEYICETFENNK